jgi:hypothetical protein
VLDLEHATELFDPASAAHLLDQCVVALDQLLADPGTPGFAPAGPATAVDLAS